MEELSGPKLDEFLAGRRAASKGEPFWPYNTPEWIAGYRDFVDQQRAKAKGQTRAPLWH